MGLKDELQKIYDEEGKPKDDVAEEIVEEDTEDSEGGAPAADAVEEPKDEDGDTDAPADDDKPEEEPKKEEKPDNAAFARMRLEANEWKRKAEEAERRLAESAQPPKEMEEQSQAQPQRNPALDEVIEEHQFTRAQDEFQHLERQVASGIPDYDAVAQQYFTALAQNIKERNKSLPDSEVIRLAKRSILQKASVYYNNGMNPAQALYVEAKSMGFAAPDPAPQQEAPKPKQQVKQPVKAAGMVGSRGGSAPQNSVKKDFAEGKMTLSEFSRLSPEQLNQLEGRA